MPLAQDDKSIRRRSTPTRQPRPVFISKNKECLILFAHSTTTIDLEPIAHMSLECGNYFCVRHKSEGQ